MDVAASEPAGLALVIQAALEGLAARAAKDTATGGVFGSVMPGATPGMAEFGEQLLLFEREVVHAGPRRAGPPPSGSTPGPGSGSGPFSG